MASSARRLGKGKGGTVGRKEGRKGGQEGRKKGGREGEPIGKTLKVNVKDI